MTDKRIFGVLSAINDRMDSDGELRGSLHDEDGVNAEPVVDAEETTPEEEPANVEEANVEEEPAPANDEEEPADEEEPVPANDEEEDDPDGDDLEAEVLAMSTEDEAHDAIQRRIRNGKVQKRTATQQRKSAKYHGGLSNLQYRANARNLKKARKKAHLAGANRNRMKSNRLRQRKGMDSVSLETLGHDLRVYMQDHFIETYSPTEEQIDKIQDALAALHVFYNDEGDFAMCAPVWREDEDGLDVNEFSMDEFVFESADDIDAESVLAALIDDFSLATNLIVDANVPGDGKTVPNQAPLEEDVSKAKEQKDPNPKKAVPALKLKGEKYKEETGDVPAGS